MRSSSVVGSAMEQQALLDPVLVIAERSAVVQRRKALELPEPYSIALAVGCQDGLGSAGCRGGPPAPPVVPVAHPLCRLARPRAGELARGLAPQQLDAEHDQRGDQEDRNQI